MKLRLACRRDEEVIGDGKEDEELVVEGQERDPREREKVNAWDVSQRAMASACASTFAHALSGDGSAA